jgi:F0F1-type ATP synthase delta subunit
MTLSAVATRYAHALVDVVTASGSSLSAADAVTQLRAFESVLRSSPALHGALITPAVPLARKRAVIGRIGYVMELSQITRNFLYVLVDHRRIASLTEIIHSFELAVDERRGSRAPKSARPANSAKTSKPSCGCGWNRFRANACARATLWTAP